MKPSSFGIFNWEGDVEWKRRVGGVEKLSMDRDNSVGLVLSL